MTTRRVRIRGRCPRPGLSGLVAKAIRSTLRRGQVKFQQLTRRSWFSYGACAPHHCWWCGIGAPDDTRRPTADSARTPREGCVLCRSRIGVFRLFFRVVGALSAPVGGGSWRRRGHRGGRRMPFGGRAGSALSTNVMSTLACRTARLRAAGLVVDGTKPEAKS